MTTPINRVPGLSAAWWQGLVFGLITFVTAPLLVSGSLIALLARPLWPNSVTTADRLAAALVIASVAVTFFGSLIIPVAFFRPRDSAERIAGYTSIRTDNRDLQEVAPGTTYVVRPAGAPLLSADEYRRQVQQAISLGHRPDVKARRSYPIASIIFLGVVAWPLFLVVSTNSYLGGVNPVVVGLLLIASAVIALFSFIVARRRSTHRAIDVPRA